MDEQYVSFVLLCLTFGRRWHRLRRRGDAWISGALGGLRGRLSIDRCNPSRRLL